MSNIENGGPAFPGKVCVAHAEPDDTPIYEHPSGMTKRDYFAAHADISKLELNNLKTAEIAAGRPMPTDEIDLIRWQFEIVANMRYVAADAMLKARDAK